MNDSSNFIHYNPKLQAPQMPINRLMVKHILVYKYHEIFLKNKEEQKVNICNNMSDSPENYAK